MTTWIQLTKDKTHSFYRVPLELAEAGDNDFFGTEHHPLDIEGPWPFLAFLRNRDQPRVFTFQIYTIEAEALEFEGFNPLAETCGALSLNRQALADLVSLLLMYAQRLPPVNNISQKMFKQIEDSRRTDFHLHPEWFPNSRDYYYYQTYDPLGESRADSIATILVLSTGQRSQLLLACTLRLPSFHWKRCRIRLSIPSIIPSQGSTLIEAECKSLLEY